MLKRIKSSPGVLLAAVIASRREQPLALQVPLPGSTVLLTVKVVEARAGFAASIRLKTMNATSSKPKTRALVPAGLSVLARIIFSTSFLC
jgi:hypothetical protein